MSTTRQFFPVLGVFGGPTPATGSHFTTGGANLVQQFQRVQTTTYSWSVSRQDVTEYSHLAPLSREITEAPVVNMSMSYLLADLSNERKMGFYTSGDSTALRFLLDKTQDEKNYFIAYAPQGQNLLGWTGQSSVVQIDNAFLTNYSVNAAVGGFPTVSADFEGSNWAVNTGSISQPLKAVNPTNGQVVTGLTYTLPVGVSGIANTVAVLRPDGISLTITGTKGISIPDLKIQSFDLGVGLSREGLQELGKRFATSREITFPLSTTLSVTANFGDLEEATLSDILCQDEAYTIYVNLRDPNCSGAGNVAVQYKLVGAKVDSQEYGDGVSQQASTITINYSSPIGGTTDVNGLYMSGRNI